MTKNIGIRKKPLIIAILIFVFLTAIGVLWFFVFNSRSPVGEFREKAELYAKSIINGDFDTAIDIQYYLPERKYLIDDLKEMWETEGCAMKDYKIFRIDKLSDELYQLDGVFIFDDYEESFLPFYFFMDDEWHMALNPYQIPARYLENIQYKRFEGDLGYDNPSAGYAYVDPNKVNKSRAAGSYTYLIIK